MFVRRVLIGRLGELIRLVHLVLLGSCSTLSQGSDDSKGATTDGQVKY
jgi:hypothetical protein